MAPAASASRRVDPGAHRRRGRLVALVAAALAGGCSFVWDSAPQPPEALGTAPPLEAASRLNRTTAGSATIVTGIDGEPWAAFCEVWRQGPFGVDQGCIGLRLVPLAGDHAEEYRTAEKIIIRSTALYLVGSTGTQSKVVIHRPGRRIDSTYLFDAPVLQLVIADRGNDGTFLALPLVAGNKTIAVRSERMISRDLVLPDGVDPLRPLDSMQPVFARGGEVLLLRDPGGNLALWRIDSSFPDRALGVSSPLFSLDDFPVGRAPAVLTLGNDGLVAIPFDGGPERRLAPAGLDPASVRIGSDRVFFVAGGALRVAPLDGSAAPVVVQDGAARLWALPSAWPGDPRLVWSHDPASRYASGAGDGYFGGVQFMQRGRRLNLAADGARVHFLENAARSPGVGELMTVPVPPAEGPAAAPTLLALNVRQYDLLPDGRLLAVENHALPGIWNRLVVIDPARVTKRIVQHGVHEYVLLPGRTEALIDVVSGASGYDIYRAAIPAAEDRGLSTSCRVTLRDDV